MGGPDLLPLEAHRHRHFSEMHADQGIPDIKSRIRTDLFERHGIRKGMIGGRCKRTAGLGLRNNVYDLRATCCFTLDYYRAV